MRIRKYATKTGVIEIDPDAHVLPRHIHGGDYAIHLANRGRGGGASSGSGKSKRKILRPPEGGWK